MNRRAALPLAALAATLAAPAPGRAQTVSWSPSTAPVDPEAKIDFQHVWTTPDPSPTWRFAPGWAASLYGVERLDGIRDSTESFGVAANNTTVVPSGQPVGDTPRWRATASGSRYGLKVGGPQTSPVRAWGLVEIGAPPPDPDQGRGWYGLYARHAYVAVETPILDVLLGRTHDLFGWGGHGFFASTVATLGVPGEIYRQRGQLRISHVFRSDLVDFEIAVAGVSPLQKESRTADGELGLRIAANRWQGAAAQGAGPAIVRPAQIGISTIGRRLKVPPFTAQPGPAFPVDAGGLAIDVFVPLVPARADDLSNALACVVELSGGSGIADLYPNLTGGAVLAALPNPTMVLPGPVYETTIPARDLLIDGVGAAHTINWSAWMVNLQYHLPLQRGRRVWLAGTLSKTSTNNLPEYEPPGARPFVWTASRYYDVDAFVSIWRGLEAALSFQATRQTEARGTNAENRRVQLAVAYYF